VGSALPHRSLHSLLPSQERNNPTYEKEKNPIKSQSFLTSKIKLNLVGAIPTSAVITVVVCLTDSCNELSKAY
jgi:hypothetical protein